MTLTELLVTIAIIAVLASLLLPAITMVRTAARNTECRSNLRQIAFGMFAYADDHGGILPPANHDWPGMSRGILWYERISEYVLDRKANRDHFQSNHVRAVGRNVLQGCPARVVTQAFRIGYGMNPHLDRPDNNSHVSHLRPYDVNAGRYRDWSLDRITHSSLRILVGDSPDPFLRTDGNRWDLRFSDPVRHQKGANYLFCDGHVKALGPDGSHLGVNNPATLRH